MTRLSEYTNQESRFARAFSDGGSLCSTYCEACGRTYFVTSPGHGDYDEGELAELRTKAAAEPGMYIEVRDFDYVSIVYLDGKRVVIGCLCNPTGHLSQFMEDKAVQITEYLRLLWEHKLEEGRATVSQAENALVKIADSQHWKPMSDAPRNCTWISVRTQDGTKYRAHWASDLSGEERPSFEGWFIESEGGSGFRQIEPIAWRHLER